MKSFVRLFAAALLASFAASALAAYPDRPITMIVPWGAGGGTDAVARFFAAYMEKDLGQPDNVDNRA
jgi:tripartite-type tricarboxylate transporter receptor subunit TctC